MNSNPASNMDLVNPPNLQMYQHPRMTMMQQSNNNPAHIFAQKAHFDKLTAQNLTAQQLTTAQNLTAQLTSAQNLTAQLSSAQNLTTQLTAQNLTAQQLTAQNLTAQHLTAQNLTSQQLTAQNLTAQQLTAQNLTAQHLTAQNLTAQQQQYSQLPLRKEVDEEGRICAVVLPKTAAHTSIGENYTTHSPVEENYITHSPTAENYTTHSPTEENYTTQSPTDENYTTHSPTEENYTTHSPTEENYMTHSPTEENYTTHSPTEEIYENNLPSEEMYSDHLPAEENDIKDEKDSLENVQESLEEVKTEIESDIDSFMKAAHDTFLKISSKEITIRKAADLLGRPYSFVYTRFQEFCDTITGGKDDELDSLGRKKNNSIVKNRKKKKSKRLTMPSIKGKTPKKYKRLFQCEDCPATFGTEYAIQKHAKLHLEENEAHVCTSCDMVFQKLSQLMKHRIQDHEDALQCPHCDKQYTNIPAYQSHIKSIHSTVRPFSCEECGKGFFSKVKLESHYHLHTGFKPYMCGICENSFVSIHSLNIHHKKVHLKEGGMKDFICEECGRGFATNFQKNQHMRTHTGEKPYACEECDMKFGIKQNLKVHVDTKHRGIKLKRKSQKDMPRKHECKVCGLKTVTKHKLKIHMYTHTGEKPLACDICGARFIQRGGLQRHRQIHTGEKPFKCNYCPSAFASKIDYKRHNRVHTGQKNYKCKLCDYACVKKNSFEHHMNTHTGKTPFKCDFVGCGAEYSSRSTLYSHKRSHFPKPLKTCKICNEKFPDSNSLHRHMMLHPGYEPLPCSNCDKVFYTQDSLNRHAYVHVYKAPGNKPKSGTSRPRKKNPAAVKRVDPNKTVVTPQKKFPTQYEVQVAPENGHNSGHSVSQTWTINAESMNSQISQQSLPQSFHHAFPATQFSNLNAWPTTMDPDELRQRLLSSFK